MSGWIELKRRKAGEKSHKEGQRAAKEKNTGETQRKRRKQREYQTKIKKQDDVNIANCGCNHADISGFGVMRDCAENNRRGADERGGRSGK